MDVWSTLKGKEFPRRRRENSGADVKAHRPKFDVLSNIMPVYHISKVFGLLPVRFAPGKAGRGSGRVDYPQVGYGILLVLALTGGQCYGLYRDLRDGWRNSTRLSSDSSITVTCSDVFAVMSVAVVAILGSARRWRHLQRALDKLLEVDEKLGIATSRTLRKQSISVISFTLVYLVVVSTLDFTSWGVSAATQSSEVSGDKGPVNYTPMYLMYLVIVAFELQYAVVLFGVGERFRKLNRAVENITRAKVAADESFRKDAGRGLKAARNSRQRITHSVLSDLREQSKPHRSHQRVSSEGDESANAYVYPANTAAAFARDALADSIDQLITLHGTLCESVNSVNRAYGIAILMGTISCLIHLIITPYFLYNHIYSRNPNSWALLFLQLFWILFHGYRVMLFVQPCHMVVVKAKRTGALVNEALVFDWSPEVERQLKIFAIQLLQRPVEFTACGLFHLNRGLMTSIVGSVTTYLVILVQFQTADDTKGTKNLLENASELLRNVSSFKNIFQIK